MISLRQFRALVVEHLGPELERATPERLRRFLDHAHQEMAPAHTPGQRFVLDEEEGTYREVMRRFFWRSLDGVDEQTYIALWLLAIEASLYYEDEPAEGEALVP